MKTTGKYKDITGKKFGRLTALQRLSTINGVTKCLKDWCKYYNVNYKTVWGRIKRGISIEKALTL